LVYIVIKLSDEIWTLRKDISATECRCRLSDTPDARWHEAVPPAAKANEHKSYGCTTCWPGITPAGSTAFISHRTNPEVIHMSSADNPVYQAGIRADGFSTVVKKMRNKPCNFCNISNSGMHISRPIMVGVRNSTSLPVISQKSSHITSWSWSDIENFLRGHLTLTSFSYPKLKTKFFSYSFLICVTEDDFAHVNENEAWPNGCLIAPFKLGAGLSKYSPLNVPTDLLKANRLFHHVLVSVHQKQHFPPVL